MPAKTIEERIKEAEEKVQQARAKLQKLEGLNKLKERKERTRRLIQVGGIMARLGITTAEQAEALRKSVMDGSGKFKEWWTRTVGPIPGETESGKENPAKEKQPP